MRTVLENMGELHHRVYNIPTSALQLNGKKIKYFDLAFSKLAFSPFFSLFLAFLKNQNQINVFFE